MSENGKDLKALQDENATLKTEKAQLENDKKSNYKKKRKTKEKAYTELQKKAQLAKKIMTRKSKK